MNTNALARAIRSLKAGLASLIVGAGVAMPASGLAADIEWKMHSVWPEHRPEAKFGQRFADLVNEKAGERLNISFYAGGSLGINDVDLGRILPAASVVQAALLFPSYLSRDMPSLAYIVVPGAVPSKEKNLELVPLLKELYAESFKEYGIATLGFIQNPYSSLDIICKEPVNSIEQLKSKKIRTYDQFTRDVWESLGVSAQVIPQGDLYLAMSTGVVDCAFHPIGLVKGISLQEIGKFSSFLTPSILNPINIVVSQKALDALPHEVQAILAEAAATVEAEAAELFLSGAFDNAAADDLKASGFTVIEPFSEADQAAFREAASRQWEAVTRGNAKSAEYHARVNAILAQ